MYTFNLLDGVCFFSQVTGVWDLASQSRLTTPESKEAVAKSKTEKEQVLPEKQKRAIPKYIKGRHTWGWYNSRAMTKNFTLWSLLHHTNLFHKVEFIGKDLHQLIPSIPLIGLTLLGFWISHCLLFICKRKKGHGAPDYLLTISQCMAWHMIALLILFQYLLNFPRATNTFAAKFWSVLKKKIQNYILLDFKKLYPKKAINNDHK